MTGNNLWAQSMFWCDNHQSLGAGREREWTTWATDGRWKMRADDRGQLWLWIIYSSMKLFCSGGTAHVDIADIDCTIKKYTLTGVVVDTRQHMRVLQTSTTTYNAVQDLIEHTMLWDPTVNGVL